MKKIIEHLKNETTIFEKYAYPITLFFVLNSIFLAWINLKYFEAHMVERSGLLKQFQPMAMLAIILLSSYRAFAFRKIKGWRFLAGSIFFCILFTFSLGETMTWGQRIFEYPTPSFFLQYNTQGMPTIHNLAFGSFRVNKVVFGLLLGIIVGLYSIFGTLLYKPETKIGKFLDAWGIPIARWYHVVTLIIAFALSKMVLSGKKGEVIQFAGMMIFLFIFINPINKKNFQK